MRRNLIRAAGLGALLAAFGCAPLPSIDLPTREATALVNTMPAMKTFALRPVAPPTRANADIARDFVDLSFRMESGRVLDRMTRFEGPITLRVVGRAPVSLAPDLGRLLQRLRAEAGIKISVTQSETANINIVLVPRAQMQRAVPGAACFVVPNTTDWEDFRRARRTVRADWTRLTTREQVAIFVPSNAAPQELRDCLHEELAQALGPLNDLYRLPDSVFNDDNIHTVLTGFDMLVLRAYYSPELRNGMTETQVRARLPQLLARLNPAGEGVGPEFRAATTLDWRTNIAEALGGTRAPKARRDAAEMAIAIARKRGWIDARLGFSHYALGRLTIATEPQRAFNSFVAADSLFQQSPTTALHSAYVGAQIAAFALLDGDADTIIAITDRHIPTAAQHENAALMASLMMFRAEALELQGRMAQARALRLDSLGWARYGFGSTEAVTARLREIALLNPTKHGRVSF
ncbi:MAG: DUF2927 domain-containing protein [Pseudomonadota bacterium]